MNDIQVEIDMELLISFVRERPILWDRTLDDYSDKKKTIAAWNQICMEFRPNYDCLNLRDRREFGKCLHKKWTHVRDNWMKSYKRMKLTGKGGIRSRNYIYHEQMSFLKKIANFKPNRDQEFSMNNFESNVETILVEPSSPKRIEEQRTQYSYPSINLSDNIQPDSNRHMCFFRGILPSLDLFDEDETLEFQIGILNLIKDLKKSRYPQGHLQYGEYNNCHVTDVTETINMDSDEDKKIFSPSSSQNECKAVE